MHTTTLVLKVMLSVFQNMMTFTTKALPSSNTYGSSSGANQGYSVIHSQAQKIIFSVINLFKKYTSDDYTKLH
jgi:hypothetical protein